MTGRNLGRFVDGRAASRVAALNDITHRFGSNFRPDQTEALTMLCAGGLAFNVLHGDCPTLHISEMHRHIIAQA